MQYAILNNDVVLCDRRRVHRDSSVFAACDRYMLSVRSRYIPAMPAELLIRIGHVFEVLYPTKLT